MCAAFSYRNRNVFVYFCGALLLFCCVSCFFGTLYRRFFRVNQHYFIFSLTFQQRLASRKRKRSIFYQNILYPAAYAYRACFVYPIILRDVEICTVFAQIFQCEKQSVFNRQFAFMPAFPPLPLPLVFPPFLRMSHVLPLLTAGTLHCSF